MLINKVISEIIDDNYLLRGIFVYKYFSELDNPNDFSVYLAKRKIDVNDDKKYYVDNVDLADINFFTFLFANNLGITFSVSFLFFAKNGCKSG